MATHAPPAGPIDDGRTRGLQRLAIASAATMTAIYVLIASGVLSVVDGGEDDGRLILGVAAAVFASLTVLLWRRPSRPLWAIAAALQVLMGFMYVSIAAEREPAFEVWGVTLRVLSVALLVALIGLLLSAKRHQEARP